MGKSNLLHGLRHDDVIYRIFPRYWFLNLLQTGHNGLLNPGKWEDPFENFFLRAEARGTAGERISLQSIADDWYGQCWSLNEETDAMWRIYSPTKNGIKVRTTVGKLYNSFLDSSDPYASLKYLCGRVRYLTERDITVFMQTVTFQDIQLGGQATRFAELLCIKREAFEHEREVRLLYQDTHPKRRSGGVALFPFDVNTVCNDVVLDPRLTDSDAALLESDIRNAGCTLPISKSTLYRSPAFTIPIS